MAWLQLLQAQEKQPLKWNAGMELDLLPYATGGYFAAGWVGKENWRLRALHARVHMPDWFVARPFANLRIRASALVADRFLRPGWKGWWLGGGPVLWVGTVQTDARQEQASFRNWLINGSAGYHFMFSPHFYFSPWAGISLRLGGDRNVPVDNRNFTLPLLNPEASLKVGWYF